MNALPIDPKLIPQIYYWGVFLVCVFLYFNYSGSGNCDKLLQKNSMAPALFFSILLMFLIGLRPVLRGYFGDSMNYAFGYRNEPINAVFRVNLEKEWFSAFSLKSSIVHTKSAT